MKLTPALLLLPCLWAASPVRAAENPEILIYAYDAFSGKGSASELVSKEFARAYQGRCKVVPFANAGEALNQVALEGTGTKADVLVGVDEGLLGRARELGAFETLPKDAAAGLDPALAFDSEGRFVPFDYGYLSILYDSKKLTPPAGLSLKDFATKPEYRRSLALQDPRTSSTGLSFLVWTHLAFGNDTDAFWKAFSNQILTVGTGWSGTYGLFLKGEAKFTVSYTTSAAYHIENDKRDDIRPLLFPEGNYRQTEGVAVLKHSKHKDWARKWVRALLSKEVQQELPLRQWMYPARKGVELPKSFAAVPKPTKVLTADASQVAKHKTEWIRDWTSAASGTRP